MSGNTHRTYPVWRTKGVTVRYRVDVTSDEDSVTMVFNTEEEAYAYAGRMALRWSRSSGLAINVEEAKDGNDVH